MQRGMGKTLAVLGLIALIGLASSGWLEAVTATWTPATLAANGVLIVNSNTDGTLGVLAGNGTCDLREAVNAINSNATGGDCNAASSDTRITFDGDHTIRLSEGILAISTTMVIDGSGHAVTISGNNENPVFLVNRDATNVIFTDLTITDAVHSSFGGGIRNDGSLIVRRTTIRNNQASHGGGIYNSGRLTVIDSTIWNNEASFGGGMNNAGFGELFLVNSTISGNEAGHSGGGLINSALASMTVVNTTITGNVIAENSVGDGGGINSDGVLNLRNTIVANSINSIDCIHFDAEKLGDVTNSLIESNTGCGTPAITSDPRLAPLADNGGATRTYALQADSPAIDAGNNSSATDALGQLLAFDQRGSGFPRVVNGTVDIGSYEAGTTNDTPTPTSTDTVGGTPTLTPTTTPTSTLPITINFTTGRPGSAFVVTVSAFPAATPLRVRINGSVLETVENGANGVSVLIIQTSSDATPGRYLIEIGPDSGFGLSQVATIAYTLANDEPPRSVPPGVEGTEIPVPFSLEPLDTPDETPTPTSMVPTPTTTPTSTLPITINFTMGRPGSAFVVTVSAFPAATPLRVRINGSNIETVENGAHGVVVLIIQTPSDAAPGRYLIEIGPDSGFGLSQDVTIAYTLANGDPLRSVPDDVQGTEVTVPSDVEPLRTEITRVFLPFVRN